MGVDDYNFSLELAECGELKHLSEMSSGQLFFFSYLFVLSGAQDISPG